ncbi:unnamed protein product [Rotaria magnacalcarata]
MSFVLSLQKPRQHPRLPLSPYPVNVLTTHSTQMQLALHRIVPHHLLVIIVFLPEQDIVQKYTRAELSS